MSHTQIWSAIDALATRHDLSVSALARSAGLDATAFNRSKRFSNDGRPRWPSTESVFKALQATGESFDSFANLYAGNLETKGVGSLSVNLSVPLIGFGQAVDPDYFDERGLPAGEGWDAVYVPDLDDDSAFALEVEGDSMLPLYRDGDIIVVSPNANIRRNDRVVVKTIEGEVMAKLLFRRTVHHAELHSLNDSHPPQRLDMEQIDWLARIVWATQ